MIDIVKEQLDLIKKHYPEFIDPDGNKEALTNTLILAIVGELAELQEGYKSLPWKKYSTNREYLLEEIVDLLHFVLELFITWGVTSYEEVAELYLKKKNKNIDRGRVHQAPSAGNELKGEE